MVCNLSLKTRVEKGEIIINEKELFPMNTLHNIPKKWLLAGAVGLIVLTAPLYARPLLGSLAPTPAYAEDSSAAAGKHIISVTGQGEMTVSPDVAYVNLGIQTDAATAKEAQDANAQAFSKLESVLYDQYKLDKKDVKTSGFSVQPQYSYTDRDPVIKGYSATQMLQVTYRDLDGLGTFLDAVSSAGANRIDGIQFSTEKNQEYELQVINKAMDNAKAKAQSIAEYAGQDLKGIISVSQGGGGIAPISYTNYGAVAAKAMDSAAGSTSISGGELKITTTVTVQYEF
jgi:uncharacterized protein YggE